MGPRDRSGNPSTMMRTGLAFLIAANVARYFLRPSALIGEDLIDGVVGLSYGLAIGTLLLSLRLRSRRCRIGGSDQSTAFTAGEASARGPAHLPVNSVPASTKQRPLPNGSTA